MPDIHVAVTNLDLSQVVIGSLILWTDLDRFPRAFLRRTKFLQLRKNKTSPFAYRTCTIDNGSSSVIPPLMIGIIYNDIRYHLK